MNYSNGTFKRRAGRVSVRKKTEYICFKGAESGHRIWLDIDAVDGDNNEIDIEIQRADKGAGRKRARYHSSVLDAHLLQPGDDFEKLPETYVIFITENDVIGKNLPIYTIERQITNIDELFNDGEHIIYVNGSQRNDATALGRLMQDFFCTKPDDMHYKQLEERVRYFKENEEGVAVMSQMLEDMRAECREEGRAEGRAEGRTEGQLSLLFDLVKDNVLSVEQAAERANLSVQEFEAAKTLYSL